MSLQTAADVPLHIVSSNSSSERRVNPSWTLAQFKARLEPITGIPTGLQIISLRPGGSQQAPIPIEAAGESSTTLSQWPLRPYAEIHVSSSDPSKLARGAALDYVDTSRVDKYNMDIDTYSSLPGTVQSYKRVHGIGRFDPRASEIAARKIGEMQQVIAQRSIAVGKRCRLLPAQVDGRRGTIAYVGAVDELPGLEGSPWVGVALDEPVGKNDGSVEARSEPGDAGDEAESAAATAAKTPVVDGRRRYFDAGHNRGAFVRPDRVEVGEFAPAGTGLGDTDDELGSDMEEI